MIKHKWSKIYQSVSNGYRITVEVPFSKEEWRRKRLTLRGSSFRNTNTDAERTIGDSHEVSALLAR